MSRVLPPSLVLLIPELAEILAGLHDQSHLVIEVLGTGRYLQLATCGDLLRGESVGERYLERGNELDEDDLAWMRAHGWNDPDRSGNHWHHWSTSETLAAATAAVVTLHRVHGVRSPSRLAMSSPDPETISMILRVR